MATEAVRQFGKVVLDRIPEGRPITVISVLDAVPDGWAKIDGEWVELRYSHDNVWRKRLKGER